MRILVTGGSGYLGSRLVPRLLVRGHEVRVLDLGPVSVGQLPFQSRLELIRHDLGAVATDRRLLDEITAGCQGVIHLAAVSSDRLAEENPNLTELVNIKATDALARRAREKGMRFVFSSSCAVYGGKEEEFDEAAGTNPMSKYAESKLRSEEMLTTLADDTFQPVILRNGTLFGYSSRMRFDLVVNIFSLHSTLYNKINVFGGGVHWRPFLHVDDCARAFVHFVEKEDPQYLCYNIADQNLRVIDLVEIFKGINPRLEVAYSPADEEDLRNYSVNVARMRAGGFETRTHVAAGAEELIQAIVSGLIPDAETSSKRIPKWFDRQDRSLID